MTEENNKYWSEKATAGENDQTPPGTFTKLAGEIVRILLKGAQDNAVKALQRLLVYMNRSGNDLSNTEQLEKAKTQLENIEQEQKADR